MATTTFHISVPGELGKKIAKEIKKGYYNPSEYFKMLHRKYQEQKELRDFKDSMRVYQKEKKAGKLKELKSLSELMD